MVLIGQHTLCAGGVDTCLKIRFPSESGGNQYEQGGDEEGRPLGGIASLHSFQKNKYLRNGVKQLGTGLYGKNHSPPD